MTPSRARSEWEAFWPEGDQTYRDSKESQGALLALFDRYRHLRPSRTKVTRIVYHVVRE